MPTATNSQHGMKPSETFDGESKLRHALEHEGLRFTRQRHRVFDFMAAAQAAGHHPTAEEVYQGIKPEMPSISLATVYKSLEALEECHLVRKLKNSDGSAHYDFRIDPHHHAYCLDSGTIYDVECDDNEAILGMLKLPEGFQPTRMAVDIEGFCGDCAEDHSKEVGQWREEEGADVADAYEDDEDSVVLRQALEKHGLRFTRQRRVVFDYLHQAQAEGIHPTAEDVFQGVKPHMPAISLATVYKSLEALAECDLARKLRFGQDSGRYDVRVDHHHHARCTACGTIADIETESDEAVLGLLRLPENFEVKRFHIALDGSCRACRG